MRRYKLFAAAALLALSAPAHSAQPGLQALHLDGVIRDVVFPIVLPLATNLLGGLGPLPALDALHLDGVIRDVVFPIVLPLATNLLGGLAPLSALPPLDGLGEVVGVVVSDVALPAVGQVVLIIR